MADELRNLRGQDFRDMAAFHQAFLTISASVVDSIAEQAAAMIRGEGNIGDLSGSLAHFQKFDPGEFERIKSTFGLFLSAVKFSETRRAA